MRIPKWLCLSMAFAILISGVFFVPPGGRGWAQEGESTTVGELPPGSIVIDHSSMWAYRAGNGWSGEVFKARPVAWVVLKQEHFGAETTLLVSEDIVAKYPFGGQLAWDESALREWLRGTFYNHLSSDFQSAIAAVSTITGGVTVNDESIFVLSATELGRAGVDGVNTGNFPTNTSRVAALDGTAAAYWTRSAASETMLYTVHSSGEFYNAAPTSNSIGVRPALNLVSTTGVIATGVAGVYELDGEKEPLTVGKLAPGSVVVDPQSPWDFKAGNNYSGAVFKSGPIRWTVVKHDHFGQGTTLAIASEQIARYRFNPVSGQSEWSGSELREWLRGVFYYHFSYNFRSAIAAVSTKTGGGELENETVFLLSEAEMGGSGDDGLNTGFFLTADSRIALLDDTAERYWTRSPSGTQVRSITAIGYFSNRSSSDNDGVRPAVNLISDTPVAATAVEGVYEVVGEEEPLTLGRLAPGSIVVDQASSWEFKAGDNYSGETLKTAPVAWTVVRQERFGAGTTLLIASELVANHQFNPGAGQVDWNGSVLREWLRGVFLSQLSRDFRNAVATVTTTTGGHQLEDETVFLLSATEMGWDGADGTNTRYFPDNASRIAALDGAAASYWTRSAASETMLFTIHSTGEFYNASPTSSQGVRPAVNLVSETGVTATGVTGVYELAVVTVTGVSLDYETLTLRAEGAPGALQATVFPAGATNQNISWDSSNESVVTVSGQAVAEVTTVGAGDALITAMTECGGHTATCAVQVYRLGDVNLDDMIDVGDAILLLRGIVGLAQLTDIQRLAAKVSAGEDPENVGDAILILRRIVGLITEFPVDE